MCGAERTRSGNFTISFLLKIHSEEEQKFLDQVLLAHLGIIVDWFWIGLEGRRRLRSQKSTDGSHSDKFAGESDFEFKWNDGSSVDFTNWDGDDNGNNADQSRMDKVCVQMVRKDVNVGGASSSSSHPVGYWSRTSCDRRNLVVCERTWRPSLSKIKYDLEEMKTKIEGNLELSTEKPGESHFL